MHLSDIQALRMGYTTPSINVCQSRWCSLPCILIRVLRSRCIYAASPNLDYFFARRTIIVRRTPATLTIPALAHFACTTSGTEAPPPTCSHTPCFTNPYHHLTRVEPGHLRQLAKHALMKTVSAGVQTCDACRRRSCHPVYTMHERWATC